jgi:hypothetical protein
MSGLHAVSVAEYERRIHGRGAALGERGVLIVCDGQSCIDDRSLSQDALHSEAVVDVLEIARRVDLIEATQTLEI